MQTFYWIEGDQVSEACAKRWEQAGWIEEESAMVSIGAYDFVNGGTLPDQTDVFYAIKPVWKPGDEVEAGA